jgi:hypothetical protein
VDISQSIDITSDALKKHACQLGEWDPEKMIREWAQNEGKEQGMQYAESYKVMLLDNEENRD